MGATYRRACVLYFELKRYADAERELRGVLVENPNDSYTHALLSLCLVHRRAFDEAGREVEEAIRLAPDLGFSHYARARILGARNRLRQARASIEEAIRLDPMQADYFSWLAAFRYDSGQFKKALTAAEQGLQIDTQNVACTNLRALALGRLGRTKEAKATSLASLERDPVNAISHAIQGTNLMRQGEYGFARATFLEALRLDPLSEWAHRGYRQARIGLALAWPACCVGRALSRLARRGKDPGFDPPSKSTGWRGCRALIVASLLLLVAALPKIALVIDLSLYVLSNYAIFRALDKIPRNLGKTLRICFAFFFSLAPVGCLATALVLFKDHPFGPRLFVNYLEVSVAVGALLLVELFLIAVAWKEELAEASLPRRQT